MNVNVVHLRSVQFMNLAHIFGELKWRWVNLAHIFGELKFEFTKIWTRFWLFEYFYGKLRLLLYKINYFNPNPGLKVNKNAFHLIFIIIFLYKNYTLKWSWVIVAHIFYPKKFMIVSDRGSNFEQMIVSDCGSWKIWTFLSLIIIVQ